MPPEGPSGIPASRASATFGPHPQPEHDQVRGQAQAGRGVHRRDPPAVAGLDLGDSVGQHELHTHLAHGVRDEPADVGIEGADGCRGPVDDGDVQPAHLAGLGHLEPDVAATDDHDPLHVPAVQLGAQRGTVVEGLHAVDPGRVDPGYGWARRDAARGVDEVVVRLVVLATCVEVAGPHRARRQVDPDDLGARAQVDAVTAVLLGSAGHELVHVLDRAADPVGDAAGRVRGVAAALEGDDRQLVRAAALARLARRAHPRGVAPDHDQPSAHDGNASPTAGAAWFAAIQAAVWVAASTSSTATHGARARRCGPAVSQVTTSSARGWAATA